jgi:phage shock protein A
MNAVIEQLQKELGDLRQRLAELESQQQGIEATANQWEGKP